MNKRTARRLAAATALTVPSVIGAGSAAHAGATFLTPRANTAVGGKSVTIYAQFSAPRPVVSVRLFLDDTEVGKRAFKPGGTSGSVNFQWDSTAAGTGAHKVTLRMYDSAGQVVGVQSIPVSVVNGSGPDTVPPQVTIVAPSPNATLHGSFDVKVLATDNSGDAPYVSMFVDKELRSVSNRQPYSVTVDSTQYANGSHTLEAWAYDAANNKGTATPVRFNVNNPGGATTINADLNAPAPAPVEEPPAPTTPHVSPVAAPKPVAATHALPETPTVTPVVSAPAAVTPAPKPATPRRVAQVAPKRAAPAKHIAAAPKSVLTPNVPVQAVLEAAPDAAPAPVTPPGAISELPVETVPVADFKPVPMAVPKPILPKIEKAEPVAPKMVVAPKPTFAPTHKPVFSPAKPQPAKAPEPVFVLKMQGDTVTEASPAPAPAAPQKVTAKPAPKARKTLVARVSPVEMGNPVPHPAHIAHSARPTAPVVRVHSNPAPIKAIAAPAHKQALKPVIVPELPPDRVHNGRIVHAVRPGDTPAHVARTYGVTVKRLLAANLRARQWQFRIGQTVTIPSPVRIAFNDEPVQFDVAPRIISGITTAGLRGICEAAGGKVEWNAKTHEVRVVSGETDIVLRIGSRFARVNGERVALDVAAGIHGGRTLVPVRFLTDALKLHAEYDLRSGEINLNR
ncbi:MAG TPA: Ig-like domain-containing protein [Armatimonadota bacterium]|jgi:hypothetical protein